MVHVNVEVRKWGNSLGIIIPKKTARKIEITEGEKVEVDIVKKKLVDGFGILKGARPFREEDEAHERLW